MFNVFGPLQIGILCFLNLFCQLFSHNPCGFHKKNIHTGMYQGVGIPDIKFSSDNSMMCSMIAGTQSLSLFMQCKNSFLLLAPELLKVPV